MTAFDFDRARRANPGMIVFTVIKDGAKRLIVVAKERAKEVSKLLPNWTFGALHGSTIHLKGGDPDGPDLLDGGSRRSGNAEHIVLRDGTGDSLRMVDSGTTSTKGGEQCFE